MDTFITTNGMSLYHPTTSATGGVVPVASGLINVRAVETKDGWRAQVRVGDKIVWERTSYADRDKAITAANEHCVDVLAALFA